MRWLVAVATLGLLTLAPATAYATPAAPDVSTLPTVPDEGFRDSVGNLYFQTPGGLLCAILTTERTAGCSGRLPSAPDGANEVTLTGTGATFEVADAPRFVRASGPAAPVLTEGHRLVDGDLTCAVTTGTRWGPRARATNTTQASSPRRVGVCTSGAQRVSAS